MVPEWTWDPEKARANLRKHDVSFAEAFIALEDPLALTVPDRTRAEERLVTIGRDAEGVLLVVADFVRERRPHPLCSEGYASRTT